MDDDEDGEWGDFYAIENEDEDQDDTQDYFGYYCSMPGELDIKDTKLLEHLEWQSKLIEEGLISLTSVAVR